MSELIKQGEKLPQSTELFQLIFENVVDYAIFITDLEGAILSWNPGIERLLGYTESEIVGQSLAVIFLPEDVTVGAHVREMETAAKSGQAAVKRWYQRRDGTRFWASGVVTALKNEDGTLRGFAKIMRDDTALKLIEEQLHESEALNRSILESSVDCVMVLNLNGNLLSTNAPGLGIMEIDDFTNFKGCQWTDFGLVK